MFGADLDENLSTSIGALGWFGHFKVGDHAGSFAVGGLKWQRHKVLQLQAIFGVAEVAVPKVSYLLVHPNPTLVWR